MDVTTDNGLGNVHTAADGSVVIRGHAVVLSQLVDLDLNSISTPGHRSLVGNLVLWSNLSKFTDVADSLALERAEVFGDSTALQVDKASEGLIEQGANRSNREVTGFGLFPVSIVPDYYLNMQSHLQQGYGSWP